MERFEKFISPEPNSGCWLWAGCVDRKGYGEFRFRGRSQFAHRVSFILHHGEIAKGLCVLHRCDNPSCVNPEHLFLGSVADNNDDMRRKGRQASGTRNGQAKLTPSQIAIIRKSTAPQKALAREFGVNQSTISDVRCKISWKHPTR